MKILLLNPPTFDNKKFIREGRCTQKSDFWATLWPPITLAYMGAILEKDGHEARIIDCATEDVDIDGLVGIIKEFNPELVLWSSATPSIKSDLKLAALIKEHSSIAKTAIFGVHSSVFPKECLEECPSLDFIVIGEPELTVKELTDAVAGKIPFDKVRGLAFRTKDGAVKINESRELMKDLDLLPFPAWHLIKRDKYKLPLKGHPFLLVLPSRGCPYSCTFCTAQNYYGKKVRLRSVKNVVDEMEQNLKRFHINHFFFWSETFTFDKNYVTRLCDEIMKRKLKISWTCNSRVDVVDGLVLKKMAKAGCWMVSFGIESGCQEILDNVKKGIKVNDIQKAVRLAKEAGLSVVGHFILGLPGETPQTLEKTIKFSRSLGLDFAQYYCAAPFPGSELYNTAVKEGWLNAKDFALFSQDEPILNLPTISVKELSLAKDKAYKEFYYNPMRALGVLRYLNFCSVKNLIRTAGQMAAFATLRGAKK